MYRFPQKVTRYFKFQVCVFIRNINWFFVIAHHLVDGKNAARGAVAHAIKRAFRTFLFATDSLPVPATPGAVSPLHYLSLFDSLLEAVSRLDWSDPSAALAAFTAPSWLKETLEACIYALVPEGAEYSSEVASAVEGAITRAAACFIVFLILAVLGGMASFLVTRFLVKRSMAKRALKDNLLSALFDLAFTVLLVAAVIILGILRVPGAILAAIALIVLYSAAALLKSFLLFGRKKLKWKQVVNWRNIGGLVLSDFLIFLLFSACMALTVTPAGEVAGTLLSLPFLFIGLLVILYNAEAFVRYAVEQRKARVAAALQEERKEEQPPEAENTAPPDRPRRCPYTKKKSPDGSFLMPEQNRSLKKLQIYAHFAIISLGKKERSDTAERSNGVVTSCTHLSCIHQPRAARLSLRLGLARHPPRT